MTGNEPQSARRLHELDRDSVRIAHVDHASSGVRARFEGLRFAGGAPARRYDCVQHSV